MPYRKFAKALDDALRDTQKARQAHSDPQFDKALQKDRRGTLRRFATVESALKDREKAERAKAKKK
jgi:hypothetical protein